MVDEKKQDALKEAHPPDAGFGALDGKVSILGLLLGWGIGLGILATLIGVTLHFGDVSRFMAALQSAEPAWLMAALLFQVLTYVCAAATWSRTLTKSGIRHRLTSLLDLAVVELFVNQAVPTGGLSGSIMVVRGLARRGVPSSIAATALLLAAASYYAAYLALAIFAFLLLWWEGDFNNGWVVISLTFVLVISALVGLAIVAIRSDGHFLPDFVMRWKPAVRISNLFRQVHIDFRRNARVLSETVLLQALIFLFDAATLYCASHAVGADIGPEVAFAAFMLGSVVATIAPIPLGLGSFEATCVGMLHLLGSGTEEALAATLIFRGFTFWLPMLPGLWLVYREARKRRASGKPLRG